jgi:hypothetical protein
MNNKYSLVNQSSNLSYYKECILVNVSTPSYFPRSSFFFLSHFHAIDGLSVPAPNSRRPYDKCDVLALIYFPTHDTDVSQVLFFSVTVRTFTNSSKLTFPNVTPQTNSQTEIISNLSFNSLIVSYCECLIACVCEANITSSDTVL